MKKSQLLVVGAIAISFCATGCKMSSQKPTSDSDSVAVDTTCVDSIKPLTLSVDSIGYHKKAGSGFECTISADYPRGDDSLAVGVRKFIASELAAHYIPRDMMDDTKQLRKYPIYKGDDDGKKIIDFYGTGTTRYLTESWKEMAENYDSHDEIPTLYQQLKIKKSEETATYVTYSVTDERNMGGAHGSYNFYDVNISKLTFKPVKMVDSSRLRALQPLLRKGALSYLRECGETSATDSTLNSYLILPDNGLIPLPANSPWLEKDTLKFVYQQYEIAPYAVGPVSFNIAVKDIKKYLTKEGKALLGK